MIKNNLKGGSLPYIAMVAVVAIVAVTLLMVRTSDNTLVGKALYRNVGEENSFNGVVNCVESDGDYTYPSDLLVVGRTDNGIVQETDACFNNDILREYRCVGRSVYLVEHSCSGVLGKGYMCAKGACMPA